MNKFNIIKAFTERAGELNEADLLDVGDYIDSLIEGNRKNNKIDKQNLLRILETKDIYDIKQLAIKIRNANLMKGSVAGYTGKPIVIEWLMFNLDCTTIQANALIKLMFVLGYAEISYNDNFRIRKDNV